MDINIGSRIEAIMGYRKLSQKEFAKLLETTDTTVRFWQKEERRPSYEYIYRILELFPEIDGNWLVTGQGEMLSISDEAYILNTNYAMEPPKNSHINEPNICKDCPFINMLSQFENQLEEMKTEIRNLRNEKEEN